MRRIFAATAIAAATLMGFAGPTQAADNPSIMLLHGIPGATVDVVVDGAVVIPGFKPGSMQDLTSFKGQTLKNVEVRAAGTTDVVIGPVAELAVPASGNVTLVAHLDAAGKPTLSAFTNDISVTPAGQGRLTVRHAAAAPAVDIVLGDARPFTNLANGKEGKANLPAGPIAGAKIAPTGGAPIADVPTVELKAGSNLIVYAVGSLDGGTFTFYTQELTGLGGAPTAVNTGGEAPGASSPIWALTAALGAIGVLVSMAALNRRRITVGV